MVEPISTAAAIPSLLLTLTKLVKLCNDVREKYKNAEWGIGNIASECAVVKAALGQLQDLLDGMDSESWKSQAGDGPIVASLEEVTIACASTFSLLTEYLSDATDVVDDGSSGRSSGASRKQRANFVWNEEKVQSFMTQLRGHQSSLTLLLTVLQVRSEQDTKRILLEQTALLLDIRNMLRMPARSEYRLSMLSGDTIQAVSEKVRVPDIPEGIPEEQTDPTRNSLLVSKPDPPKTAKVPTIKCVVVGDNCCDKTKFILSYTTGSFPSEYVPTVFDNYAVDIKVGDKPYKLALWDTAGQEDYDRLRPLSYPQTDVFILAFCIVSPISFDNIRTLWYPELQRHAPGVPIILIGVKKALREDPKIVEKLQRSKLEPIKSHQGLELAKFVSAYRYIECDALTRENVDAVFDEAIHAVLNPELGMFRKVKKSRFSFSRITSQT